MNEQTGRQTVFKMRGLLLLCFFGYVLGNSNSNPCTDLNTAHWSCYTATTSNTSISQEKVNGTSVNLNGTSNATETRPEIDPKPADTKETKVQPEKASGSQSEPKKKMKKRQTKNPPRRPSTGVWHGLSSSSGFPTQSPEGNVDQLLPDQRNDTSVNLNGTSNATETRPEIDPKPADTKETKVQPEKASGSQSKRNGEQKKRRTHVWHPFSSGASEFPTAPPEPNVEQKKKK